MPSLSTYIGSVHICTKSMCYIHMFMCICGYIIIRFTHFSSLIEQGALLLSSVSVNNPTMAVLTIPTVAIFSVTNFFAKCYFNGSSDKLPQLFSSSFCLSETTIIKK
jgi:hypothetical protein